MSKGLKLSEILVTVLISVVFAVIYNLWWFVYNGVQATGLHLEQLTNGVWFMAAIVCYRLFQNQVLLYWLNLLQVPAKLSLWVVSIFRQSFYAFIQGLACELVFAIFKYQSRSVMVAMLAGFCTAIAAFPDRLFLWLFK
ncbi:ECF transporter S component [Staphylococcus aureus]|nr:ECF transporter S component [Staphylococcus aureus]